MKSCRVSAMMTDLMNYLTAKSKAGNGNLLSHIIWCSRSLEKRPMIGKKLNGVLYMLKKGCLGDISFNDRVHIRPPGEISKSS
jgi:hypothetical protein